VSFTSNGSILYFEGSIQCSSHSIAYGTELFTLRSSCRPRYVHDILVSCMDSSGEAAGVAVLRFLPRGSVVLRGETLDSSRRLRHGIGSICLDGIRLLLTQPAESSSNSPAAAASSGSTGGLMAKFGSFLRGNSTSTAAETTPAATTAAATTAAAATSSSSRLALPRGVAEERPSESLAQGRYCPAGALRQGACCFLYGQVDIPYMFY
jgi:hypothetical protein